MAVSVYLSARYSRRDELIEYAEELKELGFEIKSRWLYTEHRINDEELMSDLDKGRKYAEDDFNDTVDSMVCIFFSEEPRSNSSRGGRHVEFGLAYASGCWVMVVGPRENVFHCLDDIDQFDTWEEARDALVEMREGYLLW